MKLLPDKKEPSPVLRYDCEGYVKIPFRFSTTNNAWYGWSKEQIERELQAWIRDPVTWGRGRGEVEYHRDSLTVEEIVELILEDRQRP